MPMTDPCKNSIFTYMNTIKIHHSCTGKYTSPMDPIWDISGNRSFLLWNLLWLGYIDKEDEEIQKGFWIWQPIEALSCPTGIYVEVPRPKPYTPRPPNCWQDRDLLRYIHRNSSFEGTYREWRKQWVDRMEAEKAQEAEKKRMEHGPWTAAEWQRLLYESALAGNDLPSGEILAKVLANHGKQADEEENM